MDRFRFALPLFSLAALLAIVVESACAQCNRKTLMQWSYGTSFEGGPDLDEPLVTDRPDFTESPITVGLGVVQLEMGYSYTYDDDANSSTRTHSFPESLLRIGTLADWFELRIDWNYLEERETEFGGSVNTASGADDLTIGFKLALTPQECCLPETGIIFQSGVPSGSTDFTAEEMLPGVLYLYAWDLNEKWSTGGLTAIHRAKDEVTDDAYALIHQSWTLGRSWTDRIASYVEWFAFVPWSADTDPTQHNLDGGFTVLLSNDVQWDILAGIGLNDAADDYFVGTGLSVRFK